MRRRFVLASGGLAATLLAVPLLAVEGDETPAPARPVHRSAEELVEHTLGATRAYLAEDGATMRAELDSLNAASPPLDRDRDEAYGHEILSFDQAFHITIDRSREFATAGRLEDAFTQFVWIQRACLTCHKTAREKGLLPEPAGTHPGDASSASPSDSGSPSRSSGETP